MEILTALSANPTRAGNVYLTRPGVFGFRYPGTAQPATCRRPRSKGPGEGHVIGLFPVGLGWGLLRTRRAVQPLVAGRVKLLFLTVWIWCVGLALTGSWQLACVAAPLCVLVVAAVLARTERPPTSQGDT